MTQKRISILVQAQQTRRAAHDVDQVKDSVKGLGDESETTGKKTRKATDETERFHDRLERLSATLSGEFLGRLKNLLMPAGIIAGLGMATQLVGVFGAGVVALTAALAPATGALVAFPALALAAGQGLGVVRLATAGVSDAVGGLNANLDTSSAKFKSLSGPARAFARILQGLKPGVRDLQRQAQRGLFPGVTDGLKAMRPLLSTLGPIVSETAKLLGGLARRAGEMFGSSAWRRDLGTVGKSNEDILRNLGNAGLHFADAARRLLIAVQPLAQWMSRLVLGFAKWLDTSTKASRQSGALRSAFEQTRVTLTKLGDIAGNLGSVLVATFKGAYGPGQQLLGSLVRGSTALKGWATSVGGARDIRSFFQRAVGPVRELGRVVRDVVKGFANLSGSGNVAPMIRQIRTKLLPVLGRVLKTTTDAFGPALVTMITNLARAFAPLTGSSGPLVLLAKAIGGIANVAATIEDKVPGASTALSAFGGVLSVLGAIGIASFASQLFGVSRGLAAVKVAFVALAANPLGLAITAVAALAAGVVIAYKKSATFRGIVKDVWQVIKTALTPEIWLAKTAFEAVKTIVEKLGGAFKTAFTGLGGFVKGIFNGIVDFIRGAINTLIDILNGAIKAYNAIPLAPNLGLIGHVGESGNGGTFDPGLDGSNPLTPGSRETIKKANRENITGKLPAGPGARSPFGESSRRLHDDDIGKLVTGIAGALNEQRVTLLDADVHRAVRNRERRIIGAGG